MESTIKLEAEVARRNSPEFAWPTLVLALGLLAGFAVVVWAALDGLLPFWVAAVLNAIIIYAIYTPLHDAAHSAIAPRIKSLRWLNIAVGMAVSVPLWMFFHPHRKQHFMHHARTNMPEDPDLWAKGSFLRVVFIQVPPLLLNYFNPVHLYRDCVKLKISDGERRLSMALFGAYAVIALAIVAAGYGYEFLVLWLVPWFFGNLVMQTMFGWAPHHDHSETGRYRDTRVALFPAGEFLTLHQNLHLIHHMLPSVPFYRYRAVFDEIRPVLERHGVRIEGFWPRVPAR